MGSQIQFRSSAKWLLNSSTFVGEGRNEPDSVGRRLRYFHDLYLTYDPAPKQKLAAFDASWEEHGGSLGGYHAGPGGALIVRRRTTRLTTRRSPRILPRPGRRADYHPPGGRVARLGLLGRLRLLPRPARDSSGPESSSQFRDREAVYERNKPAPARPSGAATVLLGLTL